MVTKARGSSIIFPKVVQCRRIYTSWEFPGDTQCKQVPIMSTRFKDIFVSLLSVEGINKRGRGLDSCLPSEAKTKLLCLPLQSLGKGKQGLPSLSVRHNPNLSHLIAKRTSPCQPIKAVKKARRKQAWQPFHAPPAYVHLVFLHCFWSSRGLSYPPALDTEVTFSASLCCGSDAFQNPFKYHQAASKLHQL